MGPTYKVTDSSTLHVSQDYEGVLAKRRQLVKLRRRFAKTPPIGIAKKAFFISAFENVLCSSVFTTMPLYIWN
jgi:hypothetical protein